LKESLIDCHFELMSNFFPIVLLPSFTLSNANVA